jgi:1-aminocyclopropane-1-carboxylate deaminase/D-cysteine desulfhydrase-like pyridoxal-dependent ACC family enzyme
MRSGYLPTPIEAMGRLTAALGGPSLCVKRHDLTGFGFGGNKVRSLEYLVPDALVRGAEVLVAAGVAQSNSTRQIAAAAARLGPACHVLVIADRLEPIGNDDAETGNTLLGRLFGATTELTRSGTTASGNSRRWRTASAPTGEPHMPSPTAARICSARPAISMRRRR